ncbi:hypothetical protein TPHA_0L01810 [Tetrapisispora phaffii CBS 4417]|uniref:MBA1-like protein n=1 Tax=Tetrapisispora phaffii (strain ATCC 24235 / CBS 4417 / NBRC 1672 / NRRL Y-8282 / UCD 70-5) TaxID=1071381 RepID=G8C056_TETPH|nr:hypothetical protein TPHA_0L01810 [Tetrapisispora phaffii CBS 4417]CCE65534.1 hypothetical protein TPHA_0L01810 [Tetrapisispora phaffii CBS 4417]
MLSTKLIRLDSFLNKGLVGLHTSNRLLSTTQKWYSSTSNKKTIPTSEFNFRHLGVASDIYVPPSLKSLPNPILHPTIFFNVLIRKVYTIGLNTIQIALFRNQSGIKPNFVLWKNNAIECYVNVNTNFARNKLDKCKYNVSIWVQEALAARAHELPKRMKLDWKLLKFNEVPKLISVQSMMIPGRPLEHIQLVYKFNTKQRLTRVDKQTNEVKNIDKDVIDHMVFVCDATSGETIMVGSVFESSPGAKLPKNYDDNNKVTIARMKLCGDIFRPKPSD